MVSLITALPVDIGLGAVPVWKCTSSDPDTQDPSIVDLPDAPLMKLYLFSLSSVLFSMFFPSDSHAIFSLLEFSNGSMSITYCPCFVFLFFLLPVLELLFFDSPG